MIAQEISTIVGSVAIVVAFWTVGTLIGWLAIPAYERVKEKIKHSKKMKMENKLL